MLFDILPRTLAAKESERITARVSIICSFKCEKPRSL